MQTTSKTPPNHYSQRRTPAGITLDGQRAPYLILKKSKKH
jgi:hypothetical protein